jgi:hypothetical protein
MGDLIRRTAKSTIVFARSASAVVYSLDIDPLPPGERVRRKRLVRLAMLPFIALLVVAIRTMIVGSTAWEAVLFSRYYVQLFVFVVLGIPTFRALWREYEEYSFFGIVLAGIIVGIGVGLISPGHEDSFCYAAKSMLYRSSRVVIPDVYQCTTVLWAIPAAFAFWLTAIWLRR